MVEILGTLKEMCPELVNSLTGMEGELDVEEVFLNLDEDNEPDDGDDALGLNDPDSSEWLFSASGGGFHTNLTYTPFVDLLNRIGHSVRITQGGRDLPFWVLDKEVSLPGGLVLLKME